MKFFLKICWLIALFCASLLFFGNRMTEKLSGKYVELTDMTPDILPTISLISDGVEVNRLFAYTAALDPVSVRDSFVSLPESNAIDIHITENSTDVRKLLYSVFDGTTGQKLIDSSVNAFDYIETGKNTRLRFDCDIESSKEYVVETILINSESKRIYYYFRFKQYDDAFFAKKVEFMKEFSEACLTKKIDVVIPYLESTYRGEGKTYSFVDIYDSYYMVCWGNLEPKVVSDVTVTITELYKYITVGVLTYTVEIETESGPEQYLVTERFRVNVGRNYTFLLNYERSIEACFDISHASLSRDQFKIGITDSKDTTFFYNKDDTVMAFVRGYKLYFYNVPENRLTNVYEADLGKKFPSDACRDHEIRILRMDDNGDISFMVMGRMNTGEYEGKTGICIYDYYHVENRIKERLFIPVNETFQHLRAELSGFSYLTDNDIFLFMAYGTIYSYNLSTGELVSISGSKVLDTVFFCPAEGFVAWQEQACPDHVNVLFLETGEQTVIRSNEYDVITLLDHIGTSLVLGYGKSSDGAYRADGELFHPHSHVIICDSLQNVQKDYHVSGFFIEDAEASDTAIRLKLLQKDTKVSNSYVDAGEDYIMIHIPQQTGSFSLAVRITEKMMDEYFISFPSGVYLNSIPQTDRSRVTVITQNPSVRIEPLFSSSEQYEVYSYGEILAIKDNVEDAIALADSIEIAGVVVNNAGTPVWERGVQNKEAKISDDTLAKALWLYGKGLDGALSFTGASLSEMLYFVYRDMPVYALPEEGRVLILTEYTKTHVTYFDPVTQAYTTTDINSLSELMKSHGNVFKVLTAQ